MAIEKRTYDTTEKAKAAADNLLSQGFSDVSISYAQDKVRVAVDAPFGEGQRAAGILDSHGPLPPAAEPRDELLPVERPLPGTITDWAAPLSNRFGWTVLNAYRSPFWPKALVDDPAPLSSWLDWPVLLGTSAPAAPQAADAAPDTVEAVAAASRRREKTNSARPE